MIKRFAPWFGVFLLAGVGIYFSVFGVEPVTNPGIVASMGGMVLAAVLLLVGGTHESIRIGTRTIAWNVLVGVAYVVFAVAVAASFFAPALLEGEPIAWVMAGAVVLGGGSLAWFGVQIARDSRHVNLDAEPSNARLVGVALLMVGSIVAGMALWSFVL